MGFISVKIRQAGRFYQRQPLFAMHNLKQLSDFSAFPVMPAIDDSLVGGTLKF